MRKVCVITGNRSDYARVRSIMKEIKKHNDLELSTIVMGSHLLDDYGKSVNDLKKDGFKIDFIAHTLTSGNDAVAMAKSTGLCTSEIATILGFSKPDIVLVNGDRFDILGAVIASSLSNIPVVHVQGGETTGSIDESIRHAITKLSHIHFVSTKTAYERVLRMGESPNNIFEVGCPTVDVITSLKIQSREKVCEKYNLDKNKPFILVIQHSVTTELEDCKRQMRETLSAISELGIQTRMYYPNVDAGSKDMVREIRYFKEHGKLENVELWKHHPQEEFLNILYHCGCIVGNSSAGIREACYYGTPTVNIGTRQNGRERGKNVIDVDYNKDEIKKAIIHSLEHGKYPKEHVYGKEGASRKIVEILSEVDLTDIIQKRWVGEET